MAQQDPNPPQEKVAPMENSTPSHSVPPSSTSAHHAWTRLTEHLQEWYYQPDLEALEITLAAVCSHYLISADPVWLFVVAPPSTGKNIILDGLAGLENTHMIGDLSPKSFLSGYRNKKKSSLLHQVGSGILLFKDFTTFMSKRDHDRMELASYLREIYDGKFSRHAGTGQVPPWEGKITVIAAATPALERAWGVLRELGERFVTVRWPRPNGIKLAQFARKQIGHERHVKEQTQALFRQIVQPIKLSTPDPLPPAMESKLEFLSEAVARLRATIHRDGHGAREVVHVNPPEGPARLLKALELVTRYHAQVLGNGKPEGSLRIATRLAFDSIPSKRLQVMMTVAPGQDEFGGTTWGDIVKKTGMTKNGVRWITDELEAIGVIRRDPGAEVEVVYTLAPEFEPIWVAALGLFPHSHP